MQYLIVIEKTETGYSAYSPNLPGCVSTGATREEVEQNMHEAIEFHLDGINNSAASGRSMKQPLFGTSYVPRDGESTLDEIEVGGFRDSTTYDLISLC